MKKVFFVLTLFLSSITLSHEDHSNAELKYMLHESSPNSIACSKGEILPNCRDLLEPHRLCIQGYLVSENKCESMFKDFPNGQQPKNSYAWYGGWTCDVGYTKKGKECVLDIKKDSPSNEWVLCLENNEMSLAIRSSCDSKKSQNKVILPNNPLEPNLDNIYCAAFKQAMNASTRSIAKARAEGGLYRGANYETNYKACANLITSKSRAKHMECAKLLTEKSRQKCIDKNVFVIDRKFVELKLGLIEDKEKIVAKKDTKTSSTNSSKIETKKETKIVKKNESNLITKSQVVTQDLDKKKIKEELSYYKELFEEELIEKSEYDELRKALLAGIKEGSVTKTIIMNKPDNVAIKSQSDLSKLQEQLALEKRKVEAMESQAQAAQTTNKLIKEQERKKGWNALMQLGLGIAGGGLSPGGNQRQTNCYDTGSGNFNCTSYDW